MQKERQLTKTITTEQQQQSHPFCISWDFFFLKKGIKIFDINTYWAAVVTSDIVFQLCGRK